MATQQLDLNGKHVVITGASAGLGEALALEMAGMGAHITLLARRQDRLNSVAQRVVEHGGEALALSTDVTSQASVDASISEAVNTFGPVDVLIANSGISPVMSAYELDVPVIEETVQVNFLGVVYSMNAVLPSMTERGTGVILAISSIAAMRGLPTSAAYCASKSAVTAWMESLRPELRSSGVTLITSHPGYIRTEMIENKRDDYPFVVEVKDAARTLVRGMLRGDSEINFPGPLVFLTGLGRMLPNSLYDRLIWSTSPVSWRTAARDALFWTLGGLCVCLLAWLSLWFVTPAFAETLRTVYGYVLPLLGLISLPVSRSIRGSSKVPILIFVIACLLAPFVVAGWLLW